MKLSNLQAMMLVQTLRDTLVIKDSNNIFTFNLEQRNKLANNIFNQQSKELVELEDDGLDLIPIGTSDEGKPQDEA